MNSIELQTATSSFTGDVVSIIVCAAIVKITKQFLVGNLFPTFAEKHLYVRNKQSRFLFSKQLWGLMWHAGMLTFEVSVCVDTDFWQSIINPYGGTDVQYTFSPSDTVSLGIKSIFIIQIGYFFSESFSLMSESGKTKDTFIQIGHHFVAVILLIASSPYLPSHKPYLIFGYKVGLAVLILHEVTDVFLYSAKTFLYAGFQVVAETFFVAHLLVWIWARLVLFPRLIYGGIDHDTNDLRWQYYPAISFLSALYFLHVYWTYLMFKILYRKLVVGQMITDERDVKRKEGKKHMVR